MTNQELAQKLRDLAQIYESNPAVAQPHDMKDGNSDLIFCHSADEWHATVRAFGGGTKDASEDALKFKPSAFPFLAIHGHKRSICEAVVVGKKFVPASFRPAELIPAEMIDEHEEDVIEWRCRPFTEPVEESVVATEEVML